MGILMIGQLFYPPNLNLPPVSIQGCAAKNITLPSELVCSKPREGRNTEGIALLFSINYCWHGLISVLLAGIIGYLTSIICARRYNNQNPVCKELLYDYSENFLVKRLCGGGRDNTENTGTHVALLHK